jgi:hypothetical protein
MDPHEAGRFFYEGWEMRFHVRRVSSEGNVSGDVEILKHGQSHYLLRSSGVFKTVLELIEALKANAIAWVASQGAGLR